MSFSWQFAMTPATSDSAACCRFYQSRHFHRCRRSQKTRIAHHLAKRGRWATQGRIWYCIAHDWRAFLEQADTYRRPFSREIVCDWASTFVRRVLLTNSDRSRRVQPDGLSVLYWRPQFRGQRWATAQILVSPETQITPILLPDFQAQIESHAGGLWLIEQASTMLLEPFTCNSVPCSRINFLACSTGRRGEKELFPLHAESRFDYATTSWQPKLFAV